MFRKNNVTEIEEDGETYLLVPLKDLLGKYAMVDAI